MVDQRVDQRAGPVAGAGMDDQAGRLVDDDDVGVLVEDVERDRLALGLGLVRLGHGDGDVLAGRDLAVRLGAGLPPTLTAPWRISACTRLRESPASEAASHWSRRCPARLGRHYQSALRFAIRGAHRHLEPEFLIWRDRPSTTKSRKSRSTRPSSACARSWSASSRSISACCSPPLWRWSRRLSTSPARRRAPADGPAAIAEIALPAGAKMIGHGFSDGQFSIDAELADGSRVIILYDVAGKKIVGRYAVTAK